jgi:predicted transcriptional regulator
MYYGYCMETLQKIVIKLIAAGTTEKDLAEKVGCSQPTIHRIKSGDITDPSYSTGKALENLYRTRFKEAH